MLYFDVTGSGGRYRGCGSQMEKKNLNNPQNPNAFFFVSISYPLHLFDSKAGRLQSETHPAFFPT